MSRISHWPPQREEEEDWGPSDEASSPSSPSIPFALRHRGASPLNRHGARRAHHSRFARRRGGNSRDRRHWRYRDAVQLPPPSHLLSSLYLHLATKRDNLPYGRDCCADNGSTLASLTAGAGGAGVSGYTRRSAGACNAGRTFTFTSAMRHLRAGIPGSFLSDMLSRRVPSLTAEQELLQSAFATAYTDACYRCLISKDALKSFGPNESLQAVVEHWRPDALEKSQSALRHVVEKYRHDLLQAVVSIVDAEDAARETLHSEASAFEEKLTYSINGNDDGSLLQMLRTSLTETASGKTISAPSQAPRSILIDCPEVKEAALHYSTPALGRVLVYRGFFLCFWHSSTGERFGQLEYRACRWVLEAHVPHVHVPLCFHFRYKGRGVTAMSLIPVGENLTTVTEQNPEVAALAQQLTSVLSLLPCDGFPSTVLSSGFAAEATASATLGRRSRGGSSVSAFGASSSTDGEVLPDTRFVPRSVRVHFAQDGRYYFLRNHQWFSPWLNSQQSRDAAVQRLSYVNPRFLAACGMQLSCRACQRDASLEESRVAVEFMRREVDVSIPRLLYSERDSYVLRQQRAAALHFRARRAMRAVEETRCAMDVTQVWMGCDGTERVASSIATAGNSSDFSCSSSSVTDATEQGTREVPSDADWEVVDDDFDDAARVGGLEVPEAMCDLRLGRMPPQPVTKTSVVARFSARGYPKSLLGVLLLALLQYPAAPQSMIREVKREIFFRGLKSFILVRVYDARFGVEHLLTRLPYENTPDADELWDEVDASSGDSNIESESGHDGSTGVSLGKVGETKGRSHEAENVGFLSAAAATHHVFHLGSASVGSDGNGAFEAPAHGPVPRSEGGTSPPTATPFDIEVPFQQVGTVDTQIARSGLRASVSFTPFLQGGGSVPHVGSDPQTAATPKKGRWWGRLWQYMLGARRRWWGDAVRYDDAGAEGRSASHVRVHSSRSAKVTPSAATSSGARGFSVDGRGRRCDCNSGAGGNCAVVHPYSQSFASLHSLSPLGGAGFPAPCVSSTRWAHFATITERVLAAFLQYDGSSHPSHALCDSTRWLEALSDTEAAATPLFLRGGRSGLSRSSGGGGGGSFTWGGGESGRSCRPSSEGQRQRLGPALWANADALSRFYKEEVLPCIYRKFRLSAQRERALHEPLGEEDRATVYARVLAALGTSVEGGKVGQIVPVMKDFSPLIASATHVSAKGTAKVEGHTAPGKKAGRSSDAEVEEPTNSHGHNIASVLATAAPKYQRVGATVVDAVNDTNPLQHPILPPPPPLSSSVCTTAVRPSLPCDSADIQPTFAVGPCDAHNSASVTVSTEVETVTEAESLDARVCDRDTVSAATNVPSCIQPCDRLSAVVLALDSPVSIPNDNFVLPEWIVWRAKALVRRFLSCEANCATRALVGDCESIGVLRNRRRRRRAQRTSFTRPSTVLSDMQEWRRPFSHAVLHDGHTGARQGSAEAAGLVPLLALLYNVPTSALPGGGQRPQLPRWRDTAELLLAHLRSISSTPHLLWQALELYELADFSAVLREVRPVGVSPSPQGEFLHEESVTVPSEGPAQAELDAAGPLERRLSQSSSLFVSPGEVGGDPGDTGMDSPLLPPPAYALALALFHRRQTLCTTSDRAALIRVLQLYASAIRVNPHLARSAAWLRIEGEDDSLLEKDGVEMAQDYPHDILRQVSRADQPASDGADDVTKAGSDLPVRAAVMPIFHEALVNAEYLLERLGNPYSAQYRQLTADLITYLHAVSTSAMTSTSSAGREHMARMNSADSLGITSASQLLGYREGAPLVTDTKTMDNHCSTASIVSRLHNQIDTVLEHMWRKLSAYCKPDLSCAKDALQRAVMLYQRREVEAAARGGGVHFNDRFVLELKRDPAVEESFRRAFDLFMMSEGPGSPLTLRALSNMALYWFTVGCYTEFLGSIQQLRCYWSEGGPDDVRQLLLGTLTVGNSSAGGARSFVEETAADSTQEPHSSATRSHVPGGTEESRLASVLQRAPCGDGGRGGLREPLPFLHRVKAE